MEFSKIVFRNATKKIKNITPNDIEVHSKYFLFERRLTIIKNIIRKIANKHIVLPIIDGMN